MFQVTYHLKLKIDLCLLLVLKADALQIGSYCEQNPKLQSPKISKIDLIDCSEQLQRQVDRKREAVWAALVQEELRLLIVI